MYIKEFTYRKAIISDGINDYTLEASSDCDLDQDLLEDILDYDDRMKKFENLKVDDFYSKEA